MPPIPVRRVLVPLAVVALAVAASVAAVAGGREPGGPDPSAQAAAVSMRSTAPAGGGAPGPVGWPGSVEALVGAVRAHLAPPPDATRGGDGAAPPALPSPPKRAARAPVAADGATLVAHVAGPEVELHAEPGGPPVLALPNPRPTGSPLALQVVEDHGSWLQVRAPTRPNGATWWVRSDGLGVTATDVRVVVRVGERRLEVWRGDQELGAVTVGVGRPSTPTPLGTFYVTEVHDLRDRSTAYGAYALGISAYSEVYETFNGGDAQAAIHGTTAASSVGQAVSNGCVRLTDADVTWLASVVPVGATVEILP